MLCRTQFQFIHCCSDGSLLEAQLCFAFGLLPIMFKSQYWNSSSFGRLHLQMWCWIFSLWLSMMSPINNVLLCFARASYFVQVSVMKMFKSSIEYSLQNSVSIHSLLFRWKSPISAALLCFSLASYNVQVSILKLFEFRKTTLANVMLNFFSVVVNDVSYKQCAALLWSCFLFCSSLSHENV